jgi:tripartite-type tricarboxylate transporter receptor subunit TctC
VPASNLKELINAAHAKPKDFSFGTSALGSPMHIAQEAIKFEAKLDVPIVAYKGTGAALNDVLGGQISAIIDAIPSSAPYVATGKLKALAVTTAKRLPAFPNVPTVAESGFPGFEMVSWYGLWGPAKLAPAITRRLAEETAKAMHSRLIKERLAPQAFITSGAGPGEFTDYITKEIAVYARIVRDAKIQVTP